jgi:peroxiredoxin
MAQLRQDYTQFTARDAEVVVVAPESGRVLTDYWKREGFPFVGLADPTHVVASRYGQQVRLLKFGRMPALMVVDKARQIRYKHYASSMSDIPANGEILAVLDELNREPVCD